MPFLRFSRDTRGYENTYVLHGFRGGEGVRPRLLYWFRTPPNVKVGRLPLDETAIRAIEESNPDLTFDWKKMLKVKAPPPASGRAPSKRAGGRRAGTAREAPRAAGPEFAEDAAASSGSDSAPAVAVDAADFDAVDVAPADVDDAASRHPVAALVGGDGLARLRARYAELRARVAEKPATPGVREAFEVRVEALNPDTWRAGEAAVRAVERFEADAEEILKALGRRSRRRPSRGGRGGSARSGAGAGRRRTGDANERATTAVEGSHEGSESG